MMNNNNGFIPVKSKILELVRTMKSIETEQIMMYFKGIPEDSLKWAIKTLKMEGKIYQTESNQYTHINRAYDGTRPDYYKTQAFYVLTNKRFRYNNVDFFEVSKFPKQLVFVSGNKLYEVSVVDKQNEVVIKALLTREDFKNEDNSINIVVVDSEELGKELLGYGYDVYCLINENKEALFFQS